jgi:hypothetical protein
MGDATIFWDLDDDPDGNVQHLLEHGVTKEEALEVLTNPRNPTVASRTSGDPITFGWTSTGRHLAVVWEHILDDPLTIRPVTAFDAPPKKGSRP